MPDPAPESLPFLKMPPELGDGYAYQAIPLPLDGHARRVIGEAFADWANEATKGDDISFEIIHMTQEEFDELPEL